MDARFIDILKGYLKYLPSGQPLDADAALKKLGLDSMAAVSLMTDIEDTFRVLLPDSALTPDTFATAASLWSAVAAAREAGA